MTLTTLRGMPLLQHTCIPPTFPPSLALALRPGAPSPLSMPLPPLSPSPTSLPHHAAGAPSPLSGRGRGVFGRTARQRAVVPLQGAFGPPGNAVSSPAGPHFQAHQPPSPVLSSLFKVRDYQYPSLHPPFLSNPDRNLSLRPPYVLITPSLHPPFLSNPDRNLSLRPHYALLKVRIDLP